MFPRRIAASTNGNVALFTVELELLGGVGRTIRMIEGGQELLEWDDVVDTDNYLELFLLGHICQLSERCSGCLHPDGKQ